VLTSNPHLAAPDFACLLQRLDRLLPLAGGPFHSVTLSAPELDAWPLDPGPGDQYWADPAGDCQQLSRGSVWRTDASGSARLIELDRGFEQRRRDWHWSDPDGTGIRPRAYLGFAFDEADPMAGPWTGLANARIWLPELMLQRSERGTVLICNTIDKGVLSRLETWLQQRRAGSPRSDKAATLRRLSGMSMADWQTEVSAALNSIATGECDKLVVTRSLQLAGFDVSDLTRLVRRLRVHHPRCRVYVIPWDDRTLVAASPELLLQRSGQEIAVEALAGTVARTGTTASDRMLAGAMLADSKIAAEHRPVVEDLRRALAEHCAQLEVGRPQVLPLRHLQHLRTPLQGRLREPMSLLALAALLHPTPAVAGAPRAAALQWLQGRGQARRGWYSGGFGWIDQQGDGVLSVVLRSALVVGNEIHCQAGAGIVAGSDAEQEWMETELKLSAMREALQGWVDEP